jgi:hypothetical protein
MQATRGGCTAGLGLRVSGSVAAASSARRPSIAQTRTLCCSAAAATPPPPHTHTHTLATRRRTACNQTASAASPARKARARGQARSARARLKSPLSSCPRMRPKRQPRWRPLLLCPRHARGPSPPATSRQRPSRQRPSRQLHGPTRATPGALWTQGCGARRSVVCSMLAQHAPPPPTTHTHTRDAAETPADTRAICRVSLACTHAQPCCRAAAATCSSRGPQRLGCCWCSAGCAC